MMELEIIKRARTSSAHNILQVPKMFWPIRLNVTLGQITEAILQRPSCPIILQQWAKSPSIQE
jgi:hypothetical protein